MPETQVEAATGTARAGAREVAGLLRRNGRRIVLLLLGMLLPLWVFAELADEVHELERFVFDDPILLRAHALAGPGLDGFFVVISKIGYEGVVAIDLLIVLTILAMRRWREATFAAVAFVGSALLNLGAKQFFQRDRPTLWESISPEDSFSFPSGHAMGSMTLDATLVLLAWPTRLALAGAGADALFALLVGYSRVYLGVHFLRTSWPAGWRRAAWVVSAYLALFHRVLHPWQSVVKPAVQR